MNRINRTFVTSALAGTLVIGSIGIVRAGLVGRPAASVSRLDEEHHWKYTHMHEALKLLKEARAELDESEAIFKGHKAEALDHVDKAIKEIHDGLKEQNEDEAVVPDARSQSQSLDDPYPHMNAALRKLHDARKALDDADPVFKGHRDEAMKECDHAISQLNDALGNKQARTRIVID